LLKQFSLLADQNAGSEGLRHADAFVSPGVEQALMREIAALPLTPFQFGQYEGKQRVASFGYSYDYTLRRLTEAEPIPERLGHVVRMVEAFGGPSTRIQQVLCTEYDVGVGIGWHRDKPHFDRVFGLSLGSDASCASVDRPGPSGSVSHSKPGPVRSTQCLARR
jgi:alkylated DNA repair dioxygenase AlkB